MTEIRFFLVEEGYIGFSVCGHAGFAPEGENIVCAAISAAVELIECQLTDVLLLDTETLIDSKNARVQVKLPSALPQGQAPIRALKMYLENLAEEYPRFLNISEVSPC